MNSITLGMGAVIVKYATPVYSASDEPRDENKLSIKLTQQCRPLRVLCTSEDTVEMGVLLGVTLGDNPEIVLGEGLAFKIVQQQGGWEFPQPTYVRGQFDVPDLRPWCPPGTVVSIRVTQLDSYSSHLLSAALVVELP